MAKNNSDMSANPGNMPTTPYMGGNGSGAKQEAVTQGKAVVKDYTPDVSSSATAGRKAGK